MYRYVFQIFCFSYNNTVILALQSISRESPDKVACPLRLVPTIELIKYPLIVPHHQPGPPKELAGPGAKFYSGPLCRHYFQTTRRKTAGQYSKALRISINGAFNAFKCSRYCLLLAPILFGPCSILGYFFGGPYLFGARGKLPPAALSAALPPTWPMCT